MVRNIELINKSISFTHYFSLKEKKKKKPQTWKLDTNTFIPNCTEISE